MKKVLVATGMVVASTVAMANAVRDWRYKNYAKHRSRVAERRN